MNVLVTVLCVSACEHKWTRAHESKSGVCSRVNVNGCGCMCLSTHVCACTIWVSPAGIKMDIDEDEGLYFLYKKGGKLVWYKIQRSFRKI